MNMKKTSLMFIAYGLLVFAGLFLFLSFVNPLVPYDADDWLYISELRKPIETRQEAGGRRSQ